MRTTGMPQGRFIIRTVYINVAIVGVDIRSQIDPLLQAR